MWIRFIGIISSFMKKIIAVDMIPRDADFFQKYKLIVAPVLYMVAFGWGLARSVNTGGGSYLDFIVPGILALNSMNIAFNSLTPLCTERVYHKSLEEYLLAPISASGL